MPRNAAKNPLNDEGRLQLAVNTLKKGQIISVCEAARLFNVLRLMLQDRYSGRFQCLYKRAYNTKLLETEEISLREWIISMDKCGCPVRLLMVEFMANCLLAKCDSIDLLSTVSKY
jgi:predicted HTH domain antitoxin